MNASLPYLHAPFFIIPGPAQGDLIDSIEINRLWLARQYYALHYSITSIIRARFTFQMWGGVWQRERNCGIFRTVFKQACEGQVQTSFNQG